LAASGACQIVEHKEELPGLFTPGDEVVTYRNLAELRRPSVDDVPGGRGVLVKVLRVGVDGTDREINAAEYGAAPDGYDFLVIGHEGFGQVIEVGDNVTEVRRGDYVVATVRRPGSSIYDLVGTSDMTTDDTYYERGINLRHGEWASVTMLVVIGGLQHHGNIGKKAAERAIGIERKRSITPRRRSSERPTAVWLARKVTD